MAIYYGDKEIWKSGGVMPSIQDFAKATPGGSELIVGDWDCGFLGEITTEELGEFDEGICKGKLFSPDTYKELLALKEEIILEDEVIFLKIAIDGEIAFILKRAILRSLNYSKILYGNGVFGRRKESLGGAIYKFTLPRGSTKENVYYDKETIVEGSPYMRVHKVLLEIYSPLDFAFMRDSRNASCISLCQEMAEGGRVLVLGNIKSNYDELDLFAYGAQNFDSVYFNAGLRPVLRFDPVATYKANNR